MEIRDEIIKKIKENYPYLSKKFGVKRVGLFGSVANNTAGINSDVDLVVDFYKPIGLRFIEFVDYLERLLGKKVDVLTKEGIRNIRVKKVSIEIEKNIIYV